MLGFNVLMNSVVFGETNRYALSNSASSAIPSHSANCCPLDSSIPSDQFIFAFTLTNSLHPSDASIIPWICLTLSSTVVGLPLCKYVYVANTSVLNESTPSEGEQACVSMSIICFVKSACLKSERCMRIARDAFYRYPASLLTRPRMIASDCMIEHDQLCASYSQGSNVHVCARCLFMKLFHPMPCHIFAHLFLSSFLKFIAS